MEKLSGIVIVEEQLCGKLFWISYCNVNIPRSLFQNKFIIQKSPHLRAKNYFFQCNPSIIPFLTKRQAATLEEK